ncbi:MAG TPA: SRPBCC family protein [Flavitalea sp.]|nr:SRPBCC family protein [Flavitalea sp.]
MNTAPIIVERSFQVATQVLWAALTDREQMSRWYFDLDAFEPIVGFRFQFYGGPSPENQYLHLCEVKEVEVGKKISYSWRYDGFPGNSLVTFELFPDGEGTRLRLTHTGLETLEPGHIDFAKKNFVQGWTDIVNILLPGYISLVDKNNYHHSIQTNASAERIMKSLTDEINDWWTKDFTGAAAKQSDEFTVRFGNTQKSFVVENMVPAKRITWKCIKAYIDADFLKNKNEWVGTKIHWEIQRRGDQSELTLTHEGLTKGIECYEICEKGWDYYLDGPLKNHLEKH